MADPNACESCGHVLVIGDFPFCPHGHTLRYVPFEAFEVYDHDGSRHLLTSLEAVRHFERETARRAADGIGQPSLIRQYSQDRNNREKNLFGDNRDKVLTKQQLLAAGLGRKLHIRRHGAEEPR